MSKIPPRASQHVEEAINFSRSVPVTPIDAHSEQDVLAQLYKAMVGEEMPEGFGEDETRRYHLG